MNAAFRDHVTATKFSLNLGATHIRAMAAIGHRCQALATMMHPQWILAIAALEQRGLVIRRKSRAPVMPGWHGSYELTVAGEHVFHLLIEAGLIPRVAPSRERASKRTESAGD